LESLSLRVIERTSCTVALPEPYPKRLLLESGKSRTRVPVAAKTALQNAANGGTPGSPTPARGAELCVM
jgi:hypothetical protein